MNEARCSIPNVCFVGTICLFYLHLHLLGATTSCFYTHFNLFLSVKKLFILIQAQKRKLGILEDEDLPNSDEVAEERGTGDSTGFGNNRGMLLLDVFGKMCYLVPGGWAWIYHCLFYVFPSNVLKNIFPLVQIAQIGLSTRSWLKLLKHQMSFWRYLMLEIPWVPDVLIWKRWWWSRDLISILCYF